MLSYLLDSLVYSGGLISASAAPSSPQPICLGDLASTVSPDLLASNFRSVLRIGRRRGEHHSAASRMDFVQNDGSHDHPPAVLTRGASRIDGFTKNAPLY